MGAPGPRFRLPSGISGGEMNEVDPCLLCPLLCVKEGAGEVEGQCRGSVKVRGGLRSR